MASRWLTVSGFVLLASVVSAQESPLKDDKERASYAIGMNLAQQLQKQLVAVDPEAVSRGLKDAIARRRTLLTDTEARDAIARLRKQAIEKRAAFEKEKARIRKASLEARAPSLVVSYKMDPRLATGSYGPPDRWVTAPTYSRMGEGKTCTVEARVAAHDAAGDAVAVKPKWTSDDTTIATITPGEGSEVKILVHRPGETRIHISSNGASKELAVKASYQNDALMVNINAQ